MGKQNRELLENIEKYDEKKKTKQSKSEVYGQKPVNRETNKRKEIDVYNSQRGESIRNMV
jgi:hypothetical protein